MNTKGMLALMLGLALNLTAGCSSSQTPSPAASPTPTTSPSGLDEKAVRAYADPATQTILEGLSEGSLAKYTQYASSVFKAAITQDVLDKTSTQISGQLGDFVSISFASVEEQGGYVLVHYKAKYARGEAGVRMVFDKDHLVAGQWFE